jgi:oligopeptide/dipeptide ABC transporter ATP-binding protein
MRGEDVTSADRTRLKALRQKLQIVFQYPYSSLDPRMSVYRILKEPLDNFNPGLKRRQKIDLVSNILEKVGLSADHLSRFPHEFSGGQRQRIALARALIPKPDLIVCDEPVSALDVSIQAQVINLLKKLQLELGLAIIFISHDLAVVQHLSNTLAVMYLGRIIEMSGSSDLYRNPLHPYTRALIAAAPIPDPIVERRRKQESAIADVPSPINVPSGCAYHPRCPRMEQACRIDPPPLIERAPGDFVACYKA